MTIRSHLISFGVYAQRRASPAAAGASSPLLVRYFVGADALWGRDGAALDGEGGRGGLEFFTPNMMVLTIPILGRHFRIRALVTPIDATTTRLT
jgi:hypothetical protein